MATQLYSNFLASAKPKCYLPFTLPSRVNLPIEYVPNLINKLDDLTVDFSLEHHIIKRRDELVQNKQQALKLAETKRNEEVEGNGIIINKDTEQPANTDVSSNPEQLESKPSKAEVDNVVAQFDTLKLDSPNDNLSNSRDIREELYEIFKIDPVPITSNNSSPSSNNNTNNHSNNSELYSTQTLVAPTADSESSSASPYDNVFHNSSRSRNRTALSTHLEVDGEALNQLKAMGFNEKEAKEALTKFKNDIALAIEYLLLG